MCPNSSLSPWNNAAFISYFVFNKIQELRQYFYFNSLFSTQDSNNLFLVISAGMVRKAGRTTKGLGQGWKIQRGLLTNDPFKWMVWRSQTPFMVLCGFLGGRHKQVSTYPRQGASDRPKILLKSSLVNQRVDWGYLQDHGCEVTYGASCFTKKSTQIWMTTCENCTPGVLCTKCRSSPQFGESLLLGNFIIYITLCRGSGILGLGNFLRLVSYLLPE